MTTTTIYPIPGYPTVYLSTDGAQMTIRPMVPEDHDALLDFFRRIPQRTVLSEGRCNKPAKYRTVDWTRAGCSPCSRS
jgi:hypothetical protein